MQNISGSKSSATLPQISTNNVKLQRSRSKSMKFHLIEEGKIPVGGRTVMCFKGWETSPPPPCLTNSAGEKDCPWQTHKILTFKFEYRYKKPVVMILVPLGPIPVVETQGICSKLAILFWVWIWGFGGFPFSIEDEKDFFTWEDWSSTNFLLQGFGLTCFIDIDELLELLQPPEIRWTTTKLI